MRAHLFLAARKDNKRRQAKARDEKEGIGKGQGKARQEDGRKEQAGIKSKASPRMDKSTASEIYTTIKIINNMSYQQR